MSDVRIACPKCDWEPDGGKYWRCTCGTVWDTFETAARCPNCGKQWEETQCIGWRGGCDELSQHIDWYHGLDEWLKEELSKIEILTTEPTEALYARLPRLQPHLFPQQFHQFL